MRHKQLMSCVPVRCLLFACLLFLLLAAGCERKAVPPQPEGPAIPLMSSQMVAAPTHSEEVDTKKIILFGTVISVEDSSLVIEVPEPASTGEEVEILWWEIEPGLDMNNRTTTVSIEPNTYIQIQDDDLAKLKLNTQIMIAGTWLGNGIAADLIVDYHMMEKAISESRMAPVQAEGAWREAAPEERPAWFDAMPEIEMSGKPGGELFDLSATSDTKTLQFPGGFGHPSWYWLVDLGWWFPLPLTGWTEIDRAGFDLGLGGTSYNFPFSFQADAPNPLIVDSSRHVEITVQPQPPPSGELSFNFAFGFVFHAEWRVCYLWGTPPIDYGVNLSFLSQVNVTEDPAPMPGEILTIDEWACPGFDIKIFSISLCTDMRIHGDYFYSNQNLIHDSLYMDLQPGWRYFYRYFFGQDFDGTSRSFGVKPATNPLNIDMWDFFYEPEFEWGYYLKVEVCELPLIEFPTGWVQKSDLKFIPTHSETCTGFDWWGTCGGEQPKDVTLTLPVVPVVTSLTSQDTISRYGDMVTLHALVRGANGPGTSPKQVSFYNGDQFLSTEPINAQDVATFQTSTLNPCKHVIRAEYVGYDDQGNTYPTEKSLTLIVTGDAEWTRLEGYWQHQYRGNGKINFGDDSLQCYLDIVNHMSAVFSEVRDASTIEEAHDVLFLKQNRGSAIEQLDRELLVVWLNFANGGILHTQLIDTDKDGIGDTPLIYVVMAAESVRLDPNATTKEIKEQTNILHHIVAKDRT